MFGRCIDQFYLWNYFVEWSKRAFMAKYKVYFGTIGRDIPICLDSGTSLSISPMRSDFVGIIKPVSDQILGLSASTRIEGVGIVRWSLLDSASKICTIETCSYYIPEASIRLFSPQVYFQEIQQMEHPCPFAIKFVTACLWPLHRVWNLLTKFWAILVMQN